MEQFVGETEQVATASHPADAFAEIPRDRRRDLFFQLPEGVRESLVADMDDDQLFAFVKTLDPDEATDVLGFAAPQRQEAILERATEQRREKITYLLEFSPESAAGLMHLEYVTVHPTKPLADLRERVRTYEERWGHFPKIFVVEDGDILGELPGQVFTMADQEVGDILGHVMDTPTVHYDAEDADVVEVFRQNPERSVAVLDDDGSILGIIDAADLLEVIQAEAGETLYEFTGVREEENVFDGPGSKVRHRYKWLIINLGTAFLAAGAVGFFEDTIAAFTLLAIYMPVVAGMGGNAGTQSMAVTVRGLAFGQITLATGGRVVVNEVIAGAINGAIIGVLVAVIASVFNQSPLLGLVLGVSMVLNLVIAGFFGTIIPLALDKIGKDPATSATIFITTATDVLGFLIFLGLAQSVL